MKSLRLFSLVIVLFLVKEAHAMVPFQDKIDQVKALSKETDTALAKDVLIQLKHSIQLYEIADASPLNSPSQERLEHWEEIRQALEPVKPQLIDFALSGDRDIQLIDLSILGFSQPDDSLFQALHQLSGNADAEISASAYDQIIHLGMDTPEIRNEIVGKMKEFSDPKKAEEAYTLLRNASYWDLPEALEVYVDILKNDKSVPAKVGAATALKRLGAKAAAALPELNKQLGLLEQENQDFRYINVFKDSIRYIQHKSAVPAAPESRTETKIGSHSGMPPSKELSVPSAASASEPQQKPLWVPLISSLVVLVLAVLVAIWYWKKPTSS